MKRSKVELYGLIDRVVKEHGAGKTYLQIEGVLRDEGYDVSREGIRRSIKTSQELAVLYKQSMTEVSVLAEGLRHHTNTDVLEVTTSIITKHIFDFVKSIETLDFKNTPEVVNALRQLSQSQVQIAKLRLTFQKGVENAKRVIITSLERELQQHPELREQINAIVARIEVKET